MSSSAHTPWLSLREAANHVGHHYSTIWRGLKSGDIHGHQRYGGASWRVHIESLEAWMRGEPDNAAACGCAHHRTAS